MAKYTNTNTQIHKYTNTVWTESEDRHDICYIFEKLMLARMSESMFRRVSHVNTQIQKHTNTQIHPSAWSYYSGHPPPRQTQNPDIKICTLKRYKQHFSTGVMNRLNCQKVGRRNISFFIQIYIPDPDRTGWKSDFQNFSAPYVVGCLSRGIDGISSKQLTDLKFIKPFRR